MKTGTPPRIDGRTLNYDKMEEQKGDDINYTFSFSGTTQPLQQQRSCHITYTNEAVHDMLRLGFEDSPMYNGSIQSLGPRYCPSIEDKINRFAERDRHQIFVEPEGWNTVEVYVNGFSTSLPDDIQQKALRLVPGFENAKIFRPGYAIEYDFFQPTQLYPTLETKEISNLYFAGQINGTTGYEEAAAQGLMAGINASLKVQEKESLILKRDEAYIGVLIDDLVFKGTEEPYRMFTSRAEYRISLRQDNADERLTPIGYRIGLASDQRIKNLTKKQEITHSLINAIENTSITPETAQQDLDLTISEKCKAKKLLLRPQISIHQILNLSELNHLQTLPEEVKEKAEIEIKYSSYIEREKEQASKLNKLNHLKIPKQFDYSKLQSMSAESREKLIKFQPRTIEEAKKISGVSPSDISVLLIHFGR